MELENDDDGWRNEMKKYIRSVGNLTEIVLKRIKRARIKNNLPFDKAFKNYFLQKTNARVANVYTDFLIEENLEGEQSQSNQDENQQNCGNGMANIFEMPVTLEQLSKQNASSSHVQNGNQMSEQIVISIPSNELLIPMQMVLNQNSEQESSKSGENELLNVSNINKDAGTQKQNAIRGGKLLIELISTSVQNLDFNEHNPDTIDLTTDQEEANSVLVGRHNDNATPNVQLQVKCQKRTTAYNKNDAHTTNKTIIPKTQVNLNGGPPSSNDTAQVNVSHHSEIIMSNYANEKIAVDDGFELTVGDGAANVLNDDDNLQSRLAVSSKIQADPNTYETLSGSNGGRDGNRRYNMEVAGNDLRNMQHQPAESINLISDDEYDENQTVNGFPKDMQTVPDQVQPTAWGRKREDNSAIASGSLKKKSKLVSKRAVDTKKRHKCDFCEYSTVYRQHLNDHIRTHTNERPYRCNICENRFARQYSLNSHMKTHRDMFAFQCLSCRRGFSAEKEWKLHESSCKAKSFECFLCRKIFLKKHHLVDHIRAHTGEELRCSLCRKQFGSNGGLVRHMKSHGNLFRFQCSNCRQGFSHEMKWKLHEGRCKSKQYECFLCSWKFYHGKSDLLRHMRHKHTGEKPFGCSDCSKRFYRKMDLRSHISNHH